MAPLERNKDRLDFFVIGTQKGGTTALASYLSRHRNLQMAAVKEVHHFDDETNVDWSNPDHDRLHRHFAWDVSGVLRGEATPIYLYWPPALPRLHDYNPGAKLIVSLRHPTFRAHSHWRMEATRGLETLDFDSAVGEIGRERVLRAPSGVHRTFSYVERSCYAGQVERLLGLFPRQQVHFIRTDQLWHDPAAVLADIEDFLGIPNQLESVRQEYIVPIESSAPKRFARQVLMRLTEQFAADIAKTAEMTGLQLSDWLDSSYAEPMTRSG